jgi:SAM-dependent methyltransferase
MPFRPEHFDRVFCYGVLQHTPDVRLAFQAMVPFLKPGGEISVDVYLRSLRSYYLNPKYWLRPLTRRMDRDRLYRLVRLAIPRWIPLSNAIRRIPKVGWFLDSLVPIPNYTGWLSLTPEQVVEWAILDTFDEFSPRYDRPQRPETVRAWFRDAGLELTRMTVGGNMIIATGRKAPGAGAQ